MKTENLREKAIWGPRVGWQPKSQNIGSSVSVPPQCGTWPCLDLAALFVHLLMNLQILKMYSLLIPTGLHGYSGEGGSNRKVTRYMEKL